jgi:3-oxoacyl-[acyl-carrier protein] reductase
MNLKDKIILVTGASSGIGQAIAVACAKGGARVLVHYRKNKAGAETTLKEVKKYSDGEIFSADLTIPDEVKKLFKAVRQNNKSLDVLVNNAGEASLGEFDDLRMWEDQLRNIFLSQVYMSNEFIKFTKTNQLRKIVNISSIYGIFEMGKPTMPQYSAAKAAVNSFTVNLAKTYAPNILVNAVAPGYTWTPAWEGTSAKEKKGFEDRTSIKRYIKPEEIATMVKELLSNDAITGEIIRVDGGLHLLDLK